MTTEPGNPKGRRAPKRTRRVRPYPTETLEDALAVATAIQEANAGLPFDRALLAGALGTTPASSGYTIKINSAAKYGLTQGGYNDERIALTSRGESITAPKQEEERRQALVEAAIDPEPFSRFYMMLDGKRLPEDTYAENMLQRDIGISPELTAECLGIIKANGLYAGILEEVSGHLEVKLAEEPTPADTKAEDAPEAAPPAPAAEPRSRPKIFVGESRNSDAVDLVVHVLSEFGIPHEAATREPDDSSPISAGASELMRASTAAVLVIASGDLAEGGNGSGERALYQIGAASLLFGDAIVLLCETGIQLPPDIRQLPRVGFDVDRVPAAAYGLIKELHSIGAIRVGS